MSEIILAKGEYVILTIPESYNGVATIMMPVKFKQKRTTPLAYTDCAQIPNIVYSNQFPILIEAGKNMVADSSAVDGINFKMKYQLTSDNGKILTMGIKGNPCGKLENKYQVDAGCVNPAKKDCNEPTCECCPSTQKCQFNDCSVKVFNVEKTNQYYKKYDCGHKDKCCMVAWGASCPTECEGQCESRCNDVGQMPVKKFINNVSNIKDSNPLKDYCLDMQTDSGDFTPYCYDYNDVGSSKYLRSPYKIRVLYRDLDA